MEEVACAIRFLACEALYVTDAELIVNGRFAAS